MDHKKKESQPATSETFEAKQARLEENYRRSPMVLISRTCLVEKLEFAYKQYEYCWHHGDKVNSLFWDGCIRTLHNILDIEVIDR